MFIMLKVVDFSFWFGIPFEYEWTVLEALTLVAGFKDEAVVGEPVEQRRGHIRVTKYAGQIGEVQIGRNHQAGPLVELADQMTW